MIGLIVVIGAFGAIVWFTSPTLQRGMTAEWESSQSDPYYHRRWVGGGRSLYWRRSVQFIADAPVLGHGTGAMPRLFAAAAAGKTGVFAEAPTHPHQQTFAVGIQLGIAGIALLWAMWITQLHLFRGNSLPAWIGFTVVIQSIAASLIDTSLFTGTQGWIYILGVGVAAGMLRRSNVAA